MSQEGKKVVGKKKAKRTSSESSPSSRRETASPVPMEVSDSFAIPKPPIPTETHMHVLCPVHSKPFVSYSWGRATLLCEDCVAGKESVFYPIMGIEEAFRRKIGEVYGFLNARIYSKKRQLEEKIRLIEMRMDEVKRVKTVIERDMKSEQAAAQERLAATLGAKEAEIEHVLRDTHSDLERIGAIVAELDAVSNDQVAFLIKHKELRDICEMALAKPPASAVAMTDPPRELSEIRETVDSYEALQSLAEFKNAVIYRLARCELPRTAPPSEDEEELCEWVKLAQRYSGEVSLLQMRCDFCHCALGEDTVNTRCSVARDFHFFSRAREREAVEVNFPEYKPGVRNWTGASKPIEKVRSIIAAKKIDVERLLRTNDTLNTGVLHLNDLHRILTSIGLDPSTAAELCSKYGSSSSGRVHYPLFLSDLLAPEYELFDRLRGKVAALQEQFAALEVRAGALTLDRFRDALRSAGISQEDTALAADLVKVGEKGEVGVVDFLHRVQSGNRKY